MANQQKSKNVNAGATKIAKVISNANFAFLYFMGRKRLNKITIAKSELTSIFATVAVPDRISAIAEIKKVKISNTFNKVKNIFRIVKEYFANIVTTYYRMEV